MKYFVRLLAALPMLGTGISMIVFGVMAFDNALWILLCITNFWSFMALVSNYETLVFNMAYFLKRMANDALHE
jgi:hypothetical protein